VILLIDITRDRATGLELNRCAGQRRPQPGSVPVPLRGTSERSLWHRLKKLGIQVERSVQRD